MIRILDTVPETELYSAMHDYVRTVAEMVKDEAGRKLRMGRNYTSPYRDLFKGMLTIIFTLKPDWNRNIAEDMGYNITSAARWVYADSCPNPALWPQILEWLNLRTEYRMIGIDAMAFRELILEKMKQEVKPTN